MTVKQLEAHEKFQSTLPMRGATIVVPLILLTMVISIHAPHAGSDVGNLIQQITNTISIHAPHAGSDTFSKKALASCLDFNPRSPCGERR